MSVTVLGVPAREATPLEGDLTLDTLPGRDLDQGLDGLVVDREVVLEQRAADHGNGSGRDVVVVEAGVVLRGPAQQPDVDVGVAVQRDVDTVVVVEREMVPPQLGPEGQ